MEDFEKFAISQRVFLVSTACRLLRGHGGIPARDALVQAGLIGLWAAHQQFTPDRAATFEFYAQKRARGAMVDELRATGPRSRQAQASLEDESWESSAPWSLLIECPINEADGVRDPDDPEERLQERERAVLLRRLLLRLPNKHQHVVKRHYFEGASLEEVGSELGVTDARASQLVGESLLLMRKALTSAEISDLLGDRTASTPKTIMGGRGHGRAKSWSHGGKSQSLSAWARELGASVGALQGRIAKGWSLAETLETPVGPSRRSRSLGPRPPQEPNEEGPREEAEEPVRTEAQRVVG